jgi:hypothetical protein
VDSTVTGGVGSGSGGGDAAGVLGTGAGGSLLRTGLGRPDALGSGGRGAAAGMLGGTAALPEALGVAPVPGGRDAGPEAVKPGRPGAAKPGGVGVTEELGSPEVSTRPAGSSPFWPGTGSQGAPAFPDRSVPTMTTA